MDGTLDLVLQDHLSAAVAFQSPSQAISPGLHADKGKIWFGYNYLARTREDKDSRAPDILRAEKKTLRLHHTSRY